jgi:hypothetical protein
MANIPIIGKVTVGGTAKDISGGYANIGGVWKPIVKTYVNVNGVWKSAWKSLYTWKKYTVTASAGAPYTAVEASTNLSITVSNSTQINVGDGYSFDDSTGVFTLENATSKMAYYVISGSYFFDDLSASSGSTMNEVTASGSGAGATRKLTYTRWTSKPTTTQVRGEYVSDVESENASEYPDNGIHTDGYWYVKQ